MPWTRARCGCDAARRPRRRGREAGGAAERPARGGFGAQADEVGEVEFVLFRRRQAGALDIKGRTGQARRGVAVLHAFDAGEALGEQGQHLPLLAAQAGDQRVLLGTLPEPRQNLGRERRIEELLAAGLDELYLHEVGTDLHRFVDTFGERVLPHVRDAV